MICLIMYTPILFHLKLIKIAKIMYTPILFQFEFCYKPRLHLMFFFVHVLHFLKHKILWYALRCSWLVSKQWWDGYLYLSLRIFYSLKLKACDFKIKIMWSETINNSHTTCTTKLKLVKCNKISSFKLNKAHKHVM